MGITCMYVCMYVCMYMCVGSEVISMVESQGLGSESQQGMLFSKGSRMCGMDGILRSKRQGRGSTRAAATAAATGTG